MPAPDQPAANPTNAWDDLLCPVCEYSLRGLPEPRCPECGELLTEEQLADFDRPIPRPAMPWDTHPDLKTFVQTWWLVATSPRQVALNFPPFHFDQNARRYARLSAYAAIAMFVIANAWRVLLSRWSFLPAALAFALSAPYGFDICESALARALAKLAHPTNMPKGATYWRGLTQYLGGFKPLTVFCVSTFFAAQEAIGTYNFAPQMMMVGFVVSLGLLLWWAAVIVGMARPWTRSTSRLAAVAALPAISALLAMSVGFLLFGLFHALALGLFRAVTHF